MGGWGTLGGWHLLGRHFLLSHEPLAVSWRRSSFVFVVIVFVIGFSTLATFEFHLLFTW